MALALEGAIVLAGLWLFTTGNPLPRRRLIVLASLAVVVLLFTVARNRPDPQPESHVPVDRRAGRPFSALSRSSMVQLCEACPLSSR